MRNYTKTLCTPTQALLRSIPIPDPRLAQKSPPALLEGELPGVSETRQGCAFFNRCNQSRSVCRDQAPTAGYWQRTPDGLSVPATSLRGLAVCCVSRRVCADLPWSDSYIR
ncbi:MAG: hypothetical protein LBD79_05715 [Treponema sp.]|nr:hypothetical protein [Treponema sp.]